MKRQTRAEWEKLVIQVERGQSLDEVAARASVRPSTLAWWRWNLRGPKSKEATKVGPKSTTTPALLPVIVRDLVASSTRARLRLEIGHAALVFEDDAAPEYVAALARALGAC